MSNTVIKIEHLSKMYKLGVINNGALFRDIQSWWALKRGKEDPHGKIGADKYEGSDAEFWALKGLTFDIKQGDRVGIIGKNGAGKSTLLKVLSRITTPTEGTVKIRGKVSSLLEVGTGFHGELTGRENIYLNGAILGMKKREIDRKLDAIIDFSGIEKHIDTPVKRYSSGMYVRLAFAVAAHLDSDILIADEVLAVGDAEFQKKALRKMNELSAGQGRTVLFVSHNMPAIKALCNKGIILDKGRLKYECENIDEVIGIYQDVGQGSKKNIIWYNSDDFYHPNFTPQIVEIYDKNNKSVDILEYENEYSILLGVDVNFIEPNVNFWFNVYIGNELLTQFGLKEYRYNVNRNIFEFIIPKKTLLPNQYLFSLGATIKNTEWIIKPESYTVTISVAVKKNTDDYIFPAKSKYKM